MAKNPTQSVVCPWNPAHLGSGLPHLVENAGMRKIPLRPPGTDAADARDAAAAARDVAAAARDVAAAARDVAAAARDVAAAAQDAAAAAGEKAAARDRDVTVPSTYADVGTGRPCMLATCWAKEASGCPTVPARVMSKQTQAIVDTGSMVTLLRPDLAGGREGSPMEVTCVHGDTRTYKTCHVVVQYDHGCDHQCRTAQRDQAFPWIRCREDMQ